jgi:hypothetical protein
MTIEAITVIASTTVKLAELSIVGYGIKSIKDFLNHWLDSYPRRDVRTPEQIAQDEEVESVWQTTTPLGT